jgi:hypothetical protein
VRTPFATLPRTGAERFLDDGSDRSGTSTAFGTASKTSVDLSGRAPQVIRCGYGGANIVIGQHVTGTNNHKQNPIVARGPDPDIVGARRETQRENRLFEAIPN